jgi:uncharacterized repeat protein (TIGR03803 family)
MIRVRTVTVAVLVILGGLTTRSAQAQTFSVLYAFIGGGYDGIAPYGPLIESDGVLYGTTEGGGISNGSHGTVFKLDIATQVETVLLSFGAPKTFGEFPSSGVIRDAAGNLYGATPAGGTQRTRPGGTVFKIDIIGTESLLYSFPNRAQPYGGLVQDVNGNLYGTTYNGGTTHSGSVFKIDKKGRYTTLHSFAGTDGDQPHFENLILDGSGNLYGTTRYGGRATLGVVFKLNIKSRVETILYSFASINDGFAPEAGVIRDGKGNLYGTTSGGGVPFCPAYTLGCGTVFKVNKAGKKTILYNFTGSDGAYPLGALVRDAAGNLYGTTELGGNLADCSSSYGPGCGTVFKIDTTGKETVLYNFTGGTDGRYPTASLVLDSAGNLYGTTVLGGTGCNGGGCGVVFKITP